VGQSWHRREWSEDINGLFRWTGPGRESVIDFWLASGEYQLQLHFINVVGDSFWADLALVVNDQELPWHRQTNGNHGSLTVDVPANLTRKPGLFRLKIKNQIMATHHDVFQSGDLRTVGMAVKSITLAAANT